jgi:hypothetical protein
MEYSLIFDFYFILKKKFFEKMLSYDINMRFFFFFFFNYQLPLLLASN